MTITSSCKLYTYFLYIKKNYILLTTKYYGSFYILSIGYYFIFIILYKNYTYIIGNNLLVIQSIVFKVELHITSNKLSSFISENRCNDEVQNYLFSIIFLFCYLNIPQEFSFYNISLL